MKNRHRRGPHHPTKACQFVAYVVRVLTECGHVAAESQTYHAGAAIATVRTLRRDGLRATLFAVDERGREYRYTN